MSKIISQKPKTATCCHCGATKPLHQLGGYDHLKGDYSHAYCGNLAHCNSTSAKQKLQELFA